jgi:hypothetical protein
MLAKLDADDVGVEAGHELGEGRIIALHPEEQVVGIPRDELAGLFLAGEPSLGMSWKKRFIPGGATV